MHKASKASELNAVATNRPTSLRKTAKSSRRTHTTENMWDGYNEEECRAGSCNCPMH